MKLTNDITLVVLPNPEQATLAEAAMQDKRLPAKELGVLLYLCNVNDERSPVSVIQERFGHDRTWWHRRFKLLERLGYAKYKKTSKGYNKFLTLYVITDDPTYLVDFDMNTMKHKKESKATMPLSKPVGWHVPNKPINISKEKKDKINEQLRWVNPATINQDDVELQQFYLEHNYPIPKDPVHWLEAQKPGMIMFAEVTRHFPGWIKSALINEMLGQNPSREVLTKCWQMWTGTDLKPGHVRGMLKWYQKVMKDKNAKPWDYGNRSERKNVRHTGNNRQSKKEHGVAKRTSSQTEFVTID
jgi:hypothetical protein